MDLHPFFTHFPIALLSFYGIISVFVSFVPNKELLKFSLFLLSLGTVMLLPALLTGNIAAQSFYDSSFGGDIVKTTAVSAHEDFATVTVLYFSVLFIARIKATIRAFKEDFNYIPSFSERLINGIVAVIGLLLILATGFRGGILVYIHGLGIAS